MSTGTLGKTGDSAFSTQVLGCFYGISRLAKEGRRCYYTDTKRWYQCTGKRKAPKIIRAKTDPPKILLKDTSFAMSHCEQGVWSNRKWGNQDVRYQNWTEMTLDDCWRNRQGSFLFGPERKRSAPHGNAPNHCHYTTAAFSCQLSAGQMFWILPFPPFIRKLFVRNPVLHGKQKYGRLMVRKKVIPDMVMTPAGGAFIIFRFT